MEQGKKKILSDLYAIRATMSLIAENDDNADPERDEVDDCNYTISNLEDDIEKKKKSTRSELSAFSIDKRMYELNGEYREVEEQYIRVQTKYNEHSSRIKKNFISKFLVSRKDKKELIRCQKEMEQYSNQMARISAEIRTLTRRRNAGNLYIDCSQVTVAEHEMRNFETEANHQIAEMEQEISIHQSAIQVIAEKSQAIIDSATKAYPLIDLRDWENVDLLIYYFETGRADDMKEALQLVDRQRQTDQIVDALEMASAEICKTIHYSMNQLGNALSQSFSLLSSQLSQLSSQLSQQHVEMLSAIEEQTAAQQAASEAQLKEIRAQTAAQVTSQEMNRALLAKISESSSDLAEQMRRQMRDVHGILV